MTPSIVVLGHKDHGKSTFLGKLLFDTNSVPRDKVETTKEIDAEAGRPFEWAHLLDSFKEEREQEMTYDTASVFVNGKKGALYIFIDVPGHSELVHQMISGASRADMAILMVSAKEGIDEMSIGHLMLAEFLGMKKLIVGVNKMDAFDYNESEFLKIKEKMETILAGKFKPEDVYYIPLSAREGENVAKVSEKMPWFKGMSIFERVEDTIAKMKSVPLPMRAIVQDVYPVRSRPLQQESATGTSGHPASNGIYPRNGESLAAINVKSGELKKGESVVALPSGKIFSVLNLLSVSGNDTESVKEGENAGIALKAGSEISRGTILAPEKNAPRSIKEADSEIFLFRNFNPAEKITIECGSSKAEHQGSIPVETNKIIGLKLNLSALLLLDTEETFLNKFVIKQGGEIIGVGRIKNI
ncbi:MAG: GTP-binding protein [Patescibacteria group bacterium]